MEEFDAVVIGSGVNGLVAAAELALGGWSVAVIERNRRLGGFIASDERTSPGYMHDTYSSWHPLFVSGGGFGVLKKVLHAYGLEYRNTDDALTGSIAPDRAVIAHRDPARTAEGFSDPADRRAYLAMLAEMGERAATVFGALGSELRPAKLARLGLGALRSQRLAGLEMLARDALMSGRAFSRERFAGHEADQLWAPWLLHTGLSPDNASGGVMIPVLAMTLHSFGLPVVAGGAGNFVAAFESLFSELGVTVMTGRPAESVAVSGGPPPAS